MSIKFGIVGCGMISRFHARAIEEIAGARLVGCASSRFAAARQLAEEFSCQPFQSLDDLLKESDADVITVCTPSGAHMEPAVAAANAGKHVIIEKPLEISLTRCDRIIRACDRNEVVLSTVFPSRFHAATQLLKQAIDSGKFGNLTLGDAHVKWFRTQQYYDSGGWRGTWDLDGGGALMNQAIHSVDLLTWLMGPVTDVCAKTALIAHQRIEVEDVAAAVLRFENGALGTIEATTAAYPGWLKRIEIHGDQGSVQIEEEDIKLWQFAKMTARDKRIATQYQEKTQTGGGASDPAAIGHAGHTAQFRNVIKAIREGTAPIIDGLEGRRSVEIIRAIYRSAKSGRSVSLPLKRDN